MIHFLIASAIALVLSLGLTPIMMAFARRFKILDIPNNRKMHSTPTPLLGGMAIFLSTIISIIVYNIVFVDGLTTNILVTFIIGISGVTFMGLIDDIISMSAKRRLVILFLLALIVLVGCLQFYFPSDLLNGDLGLTLLVSFVVVFWIVTITNAINLTDGMDGLAGCLSLVSTAAFAVIFHLQGRTQLALPTALALCGGIAGFLTYNISPAKIFMGDAGSMFIGFMLGILTIMSMSEKSIIVFVVPVYFMLVPIMDLCMSILRRILLRTPVMQPDKMHFHHSLIRKINSQRIVVLFMAAVQLISAFIGIVVYRYEFYLAGWIGLCIIGAAGIVYTVVKTLVLRQV